MDEEEADERMREVDINGDHMVRAPYILQIILNSLQVSWKEYVKDAFPHDNPNELDPDDKVYNFILIETF